MNPDKTHTLTLCDHCGDTCYSRSVAPGDKVFCCEGCKSVYRILNDNRLCEYYDLNIRPGIPQKNTARPDKFAFLDHEEIARKLIRYRDGKQHHVTFYLPQIHCSSCLWLLENIRRIQPAILSSRVHFTNREVFISYDPARLSLRGVVETLSQIGYEPHLSLEDVSSTTVHRIDRTRWYKIGLSGFAFANIMMLSFPEYLSGGEPLEPALRSAFTVITLALSIPVITYCASEFFISAWKGLKRHYLNIDAPVALALLITFGRSLYEIFTRTGPGYLDSMSGIVFFMLVGRWLQDRTYRTISFDRDFRSFFPIAVDVKKESRFQSVPVDKVQVNDVFRVHHGELIPVDSILSKGRAEIDYSFVTGESLPVPVSTGEIIYAGGRQTGGAIELLAIKEVSQSYLTNLWNKPAHDKDAGAAVQRSFIDFTGKYFTYIVLGIATVAGAYWIMQGQSHRMWNALTTVLIVACPCALLLSANFTRGNILRLLSLNKFYLKNAGVIERLSNIRCIVFDKTGTLTQNQSMNVSYEGMLLSDKLKTQLASLLVHSRHPLSRAVLDHLGTPAAYEPDSFRLIANKGIEGWLHEQHFKIGSPEFTGHTAIAKPASAVVVSRDQQLIGVFYVENVYRYGVFNMLRALKRNYRLALLSGDNAAERQTLVDVLGTGADLLFKQTPHEKRAYIRRLRDGKKEKVLMIGDGLNDAGALQESDAGIAICDDENHFTPAADGILHASKLSSLDNILRYVRSGRKIILATFGLSVIYNIIGLYFAVQGILSPVIAAILMPASSVTIILMTYGLSKWYGKICGMEMKG